MRLFNLWPYNVNELSKLIRKLTQQATFFGLLIGVIFAGLISDRFGRIPSMLFLTGKEITEKILKKSYDNLITLHPLYI